MYIHVHLVHTCSFPFREAVQLLIAINKPLAFCVANSTLRMWIDRHYHTMLITTINNDYFSVLAKFRNCYISLSTECM